MMNKIDVEINDYNNMKYYYEITENGEPKAPILQKNNYFSEDEIEIGENKEETMFNILNVFYKKAKIGESIRIIFY